MMLRSFLKQDYHKLYQEDLNKRLDSLSNGIVIVAEAEGTGSLELNCLKLQIFLSIELGTWRRA